MMPFRTIGPLLALVVMVAAGGPAAALTAADVNTASFAPAPEGGNAKTADKAAKDDGRPDAFIVKAQALLSRHSISPGVIDGRDGENYHKAIAQFRRQSGLGDGDTMDEATWQALGGPTTTDLVTAYTVSKEDAAMRFVRRIPHDYAKQARMTRLAFTSADEMFAERFHMSEQLLHSLNPVSKLGRAGQQLSVVSVARAPPVGAVMRVDAVKSTGMVVVYGADERILASYPATIGSADTPSPEGEYTVARIAHDPTYHYDPQKNFQQGRNRRKLILPPGPNNPVGTVWIALSKPTFGIHGTPEPAKVSKTSSHGCVRLTNWDVEELAAIVKPGIAVRFVD